MVDIQIHLYNCEIIGGNYLPNLNHFVDLRLKIYNHYIVCFLFTLLSNYIRSTSVSNHNNYSWKSSIITIYLFHSGVLVTHVSKPGYTILITGMHLLLILVAPEFD